MQGQIIWYSEISLQWGQNHDHVATFFLFKSLIQQNCQTFPPPRSRTSIKLFNNPTDVTSLITESHRDSPPINCSYLPRNIAWLRLPYSLSGVFQFSASNSVNTRRIPANLYINGKLIKFSKWWRNQFFIVVFHKRIQELYFRSNSQIDAPLEGKGGEKCKFFFLRGSGGRLTDRFWETLALWSIVSWPEKWEQKDSATTPCTASL